MNGGSCFINKNGIKLSKYIKFYEKIPIKLWNLLK